jgi:hypothetical protein
MLGTLVSIANRTDQLRKLFTLFVLCGVNTRKKMTDQSLMDKSLRSVFGEFKMTYI